MLREPQNNLPASIDAPRLGTQFIAASHRISFWIYLSLAGNLLVWLLITGHDSSFNIDAPQPLFGIKIPHGLSMNLVLFELCGMPAFAVIVFVALIHALRAPLNRPKAPGLCPVCNYDLRATPTRCPECGTTIKKRTTTINEQP